MADLSRLLVKAAAVRQRSQQLSVTAVLHCWRASIAAEKARGLKTEFIELEFRKKLRAWRLRCKAAAERRDSSASERLANWMQEAPDSTSRDRHDR